MNQLELFGQASAVEEPVAVDRQQASREVGELVEALRLRLLSTRSAEGLGDAWEDVELEALPAAERAQLAEVFAQKAGRLGISDRTLARMASFGSAPRKDGAK